MLDYASSTQVLVHPFSRQLQGEEVVVGHPETGVFLAMPSDAVELLDWLAGGKTIGEAQELYRSQYGETPDLPGLLGYLEKKGFVSPRYPSTSPAASRQEMKKPASVKFHFEWIPQSVARTLFSPGALAAGILLILLGGAAAFFNPDLIPGRNSLYFEEHRLAYALSLMVIGCTAVFIHEMAHLISARAEGVSSRLTVSHRLWVLVAETDMTGLWSVPKRNRYLPILAGPFTDLVSASLLILLLFANQEGWIHLGPVAMRLVPAVIFGYLMRVLWQFFFFVRTDVYFLVTTYFDCKSLLRDTEMFIRGQVARFFPRVHHEDQSHIPAKERKVIRAYSLVWLAGRALAFGVLFLVTIPLTTKYILGVSATVGQGYASNPYGFLDSIAFAVLSLTPLFLGMGLWIRSLVRNRSRNP